MEADQARRNAEVRSRLPVGACLPRHDGHLAEHTQRAHRDVVQVADRRRNDKQRTGHILL
jgi:hypothetical protein